jgi:hypothetical protein
MESTLKYVLVVVAAILLTAGTAACKRADNSSGPAAMSPGAAGSSAPPAMAQPAIGQPASGASQ